MSIEKFYEENNDFKKYVDKYCKTYKLNKEAALKHNLVINVYLYYKNI